MKIPFNKTFLTGNELPYIAQAIEQNHLATANFTEKASQLLAKLTNTKYVCLTNSCTAALEMAALLANLKAGDEVIMPSYTFVSTATAFLLRGATPVFVDIRPDTLNLDETQVEAAITDKTKAIVPVHYAGVGCEMNQLCSIAKKHNLLIIEDAAQGLLAKKNDQPLGSFGDMAALSFHYTKNITSGLGGALLFNDSDYIERARIIWQKGTNRDLFFEGKVDKYTWVDLGSSFMLSEITAAFLYAQLEQAEQITQSRLLIWQAYQEAFASLEAQGHCQRPVIPADIQHNGHIYYLILPKNVSRHKIITELKEQGVETTFHFVPLHLSPAGQRFGRVSGEMLHTEDLSQRLLRLPLWVGLENQAPEVIEKTTQVLKKFC